MLTIHGESRQVRPGITRRDMLRIGAFGLGGLALPDLLRLQAPSAAEQASAPALGSISGIKRRKSVIWIWLRGGPSHIDSWDMKPAAPAEVRGEFHPIATNVPGIEICELMPRQAALMDRLAIIR